MRFLLILCMLSLATPMRAQVKTPADTNSVKHLVDSINRAIDRAVVRKDTAFLKKHFSDDFRFVHATGMIDSKASWIGKAGVPKVQYVSREHDSTQVELHGNIALVMGSLRVLLPPGGSRSGYAVRYLRVFALRNNTWQMVSHHSTAQWDIQ